MKIGVLYEGKFDDRAIKRIIIKIILQKYPRVDPADIVFVTKSGGGNIEGHIYPATSLFFVANNCDCAIYISDTDNGATSVRKKMQRVAAKVKKAVEDLARGARVVVACPKPELEQWFFGDELTIKRVLELPETEPLKYPEMAPKDRLTKLIFDYNSYLLTPVEIYEKIASHLDLAKLDDHRSFRKFRLELLSNI